MFRKHALEEQQDEERKTDESGQEKEREVSPAKPWNLRKRRAPCKETISGDQYNGLNQIKSGFVSVEEKIVNPSPSRNDSTRLKERGGVVEADTTKETMRTKFSVKLSKKEIEEDFMAFLGNRPPRLRRSGQGPFRKNSTEKDLAKDPNPPQHLSLSSNPNPPLSPMSVFSRPNPEEP